MRLEKQKSKINCIIIVQFSWQTHFSYIIDLVLGTCNKRGERCVQAIWHPNCCGSMICQSDDPHQVGGWGYCRDKGKWQWNNLSISIDSLTCSCNTVDLSLMFIFSILVEDVVPQTVQEEILRKCQWNDECPHDQGCVNGTCGKLTVFHRR